MSQNIYNKYSIIIPCFNRVDEIQDLVKSLQDLRFDRAKFEVIIIDDGSTDSTIEFLKKYQEEANYTLTFYSQKNKGPGAARNYGMEKAIGDFFIFLDSDCNVPDSWLSEINTALINNSADAFGGPDTYRDDFPVILKAINYSMTSFITTGGLRGKKGKKLAKFYPRSFNMGLSANLAKRIGGFGSLRHGQDIEYSHRIIKSGAAVIFIANAPVYHKRRTNIPRFYKQVFNWGVARLNLYMIDHDMLEYLHALPAFVTLGTILVSIIALFFEPVRYIFYAGILLWILIIIYSMIDSIRLYKELKPSVYLLVIMPTQIYGYGLGFIFNFVRRVILKKKVKVGFQKNYYK